MREFHVPDEIRRLTSASRQHCSKSRIRQTNNKERKTVKREEAKCKFCGRLHPFQKEQCPAFGKKCNLCEKMNHFSKVCQSKSSIGACECLDGDDSDNDAEDVYALNRGVDDEFPKKLYAKLQLGQSIIRFQFDCGATVNLIPLSTLHQALGAECTLRPPETDLRMFDNTQFKTVGMITAKIENPKTNECHVMDFYVTENHRQSILGSQACQQLRLLTVNKENILALCGRHITKENILEEYKDLFTGSRKLAGTLHIDVDSTVSPVRMPLRRLPIAVKDEVRIKLEQMVDQGIIVPEPEPSLWISALIVVTKPNGDIRICINPKPLNKALRRNHYPLPTIDDVIPDLKQAKVFSTIDAKDGFWHVELDEESSKLTTFLTSFRKFRWLRLPFGISIAPEEFQRRIHGALTGLEGIACIADDILVYGCGNNVEEAEMDHDNKFSALLNRCRMAGIRLNQGKLALRRKSIEFMGHRLSEKGLEVDSDKVEAIDRMPPPHDIKGVQRLLGMAAYLAKFVPNFSEVTAPIRSLLVRQVEFHWDDEIQGTAFKKLKSLLRSEPALQYFD